MILVLGHFLVQPADRPRVLALSAEAVRLARLADGNLDFAVGADLVDEARVNVCERWTTRAALDAFRGAGPDDGLGALIREFHVQEIEVGS
jgi:quinol monooxygenase YgiN